MGFGEQSVLAGSEPHLMLIGGDGGYSGVPTYISQLVQALSGQARFTVLSDKNSGGYDFVSEFGHRHIEQQGLRTSPSVLRAWRAVRGLARVIDQEQPDLVWAHARMAVLLVRILAVCRRLRGRPLPPVAITFHGLPFGPGHHPVMSAIVRLIEAGFLYLMPPHHLLFLSQRAADRFADGLGQRRALQRHQTHVLENCSQLNPLPRAPDGPNPVVVMTGRSGHQKNYGMAARVFSCLPQDYRLVLCGGGTDAPAFREMFTLLSGLDRAEIDQRVQFLGALRDIRPVLQQADLFLLTSRYEGMPIAALEAFEAGLPLATTDIPGLAEIVAAHPLCVTFPPDDPKTGADRIVELVERSRTDKDCHSAQIKAVWAQRFSFATWREAVCKLVARMIGPSASGGAEGAGSTDGGPQALSR